MSIRVAYEEVKEKRKTGILKSGPYRRAGRDLCYNSYPVQCRRR